MMSAMDRIADLGIRLEFVIPAVAFLSMGAGILVARFHDRSR